MTILFTHRGGRSEFGVYSYRAFQVNSKCTILSEMSVVKDVNTLKAVHQKGGTRPLSKCTLLLALEVHKIPLNCT